MIKKTFLIFSLLVMLASCATNETTRELVKNSSVEHIDLTDHEAEVIASDLFNIINSQYGQAEIFFAFFPYTKIVTVKPEERKEEAKTDNESETDKTVKNNAPQTIEKITALSNQLDKQLRQSGYSISSNETQGTLLKYSVYAVQNTNKIGVTLGIGNTLIHRFYQKKNQKLFPISLISLNKS